jgi:ketosteroid isomerase-like protein
MTSDTTRVLDRLYEAFFAGDPAGMAALMSDTVDVRFLGQARLDGLEAAKRFFAFSGPQLKDLDFHIRRRVIDGEWAAVVWDETATVVATGAAWDNHGVDVFRVHNGEIAVLHENNDCRIVREHLPQYLPDAP